jgi:hypothetical protein
VVTVKFFFVLQNMFQSVNGQPLTTAINKNEDGLPLRLCRKLEAGRVIFAPA